MAVTIKFFGVKRRTFSWMSKESSRERRSKTIHELRREKRQAIANHNRHIDTEWDDFNDTEDRPYPVFDFDSPSLTKEQIIAAFYQPLTEAQAMVCIAMASKWAREERIEDDHHCVILTSDAFIQPLIGMLTGSGSTQLKMAVLDLFGQMDMIVDEDIWIRLNLCQALRFNLTGTPVTLMIKILETTLTFATTHENFGQLAYDCEFLKFFVELVNQSEFPKLKARNKNRLITTKMSDDFEERMCLLRTLTKSLTQIPWKNFQIELINELLPALRKLIRHSYVSADVILVMTSLVNVHGHGFVNLMINNGFVSDIIFCLGSKDSSLLSFTISLLTNILSNVSATSQYFVVLLVENNLWHTFRSLFDLKNQIIKELIFAIMLLIDAYKIEVQLLIDSNMMSEIFTVFNSDDNLVANRVLELLNVIVNQSSMAQLLNLVHLGLIESLKSKIISDDNNLAKMSLERLSSIVQILSTDSVGRQLIATRINLAFFDTLDHLLNSSQSSQIQMLAFELKQHLTVIMSQQRVINP